MKTPLSNLARAIGTALVSYANELEFDPANVVVVPNAGLGLHTGDTLVVTVPAEKPKRGRPAKIETAAPTPAPVVESPADTGPDLLTVDPADATNELLDDPLAEQGDEFGLGEPAPTEKPRTEDEVREIMRKLRAKDGKPDRILSLFNQAIGDPSRQPTLINVPKEKYSWVYDQAAKLVG